MMLTDEQIQLWRDQQHTLVPGGSVEFSTLNNYPFTGELLVRLFTPNGEFYMGSIR